MREAAVQMPNIFVDVVHHERSNTAKLDSVIFWMFFVFLATFVLEAPIRYLLLKLHMENALYLRDSIYVISTAIIFSRDLLFEKRLNPGMCIIFAVLLFHFIVGVFFSAPLFSQLFAVKIFFPLVYGCALWPIVYARFELFLRTMSIYFVVAFVGVLMHKLLGHLRWESQVYETAFGTTQTSREWWTGGERRLSGFERASFDAAAVLGIAGYATLLRARADWQRILVVACALVAIYWTTTKGMLMAFFVLSFWFIAAGRLRAWWTGAALIGLLAAISFLLPMIVVLYEIGDPGRVQSAPFLLSSLWDRFSWMWPSAFELLHEPIHYVLGRGLGTIGTPQSVGPTYYITNAADNIFVYAYVSFGFPALLYFLFPAWRSWSLRRLTLPARQWYWGVLIVAFGYGLTTSMFEQVFFCCAFGLCYGAAFAEFRSVELQSGGNPYAGGKDA